MHDKGDFVAIDISQPPIANVGEKSDLLATIAERRSDKEVIVAVYRNDPKDEPTPLNVDRYLVWEGLPPHRNYQQMVNTATTEDNANMRNFLKHYVFMVKEPPGPDHWLSEMPEYIKVRISPIC